MWSAVQQAWSAGDLQQARANLSALVEGSSSEPAAKWRMWGDTAAALGDLRLAARAYQEAVADASALASSDVQHRLNYALLQTGAGPSRLTGLFESIPQQAAELEDILIGLALEADLHYREGRTAQAAVAGREFAELLENSDNRAFSFLNHVQGRIWMLLARLAEEDGNAITAQRFLQRIDHRDPLIQELEPAMDMASSRKA